MNISEGSIRYKLSFKNCEEIEKEFNKPKYNLNKLSEDNFNDINKNFKDGLNPYAHNIGFKEGFKKSIELFEHKKYSIEDVTKLIYNLRFGWYDNDFEKHIKSLDYREMNVEIEMTPYHDGNFIEDGKTHFFQTKFKPALDNEGCLKLKLSNEKIEDNG